MGVLSVGFILSHWGFYMLGFFLWALIVASGVFFIWGVWKVSWKAFLISGLAFLVPSIILSTQRGWFSLFLILPMAAFGLAFFTKKRMHISM
ncbi:MAG: hypothetical protein K6T88_02375 [Bacillus sp. (in: Bacteria)]|nr:hypothetical protein [Bacillus sp. (in: firmicutes)]